MDIISHYFKDLSVTQIEQFAKLHAIYSSWNEKINVISRKDIDALYERHILHSLAITKVINFKPNTDILDVGTGGGFPGIPLAIMFPDCNFTLVDSIGKKIQVVNAVVKELDLKNVKAYHSRAEHLKSHFDFVVSRAVAPAIEIINWTKDLISKNHFHQKPNGWLLLKGGNLKDELSETKKSYKIYSIKNYFQENFFDEKAVIYISSKKN
ncbi:MAG TPA: 16S rRNA (guanine(527)-N(7))-methyltransferase RsmG [Bacteroidia bacterium]|nr:16S rRNA (guanine(527)-N(7))-methyltransferase RsmG [Bacteroidia bacterium]